MAWSELSEFRKNILQLRVDIGLLYLNSTLPLWKISSKPSTGGVSILIGLADWTLLYLYTLFVRLNKNVAQRGCEF